jgi:hypothetical protein
MLKSVGFVYSPRPLDHAASIVCEQRNMVLAANALRCHAAHHAAKGIAHSPGLLRRDQPCGLHAWRDQGVVVRHARQQSAAYRRSRQGRPVGRRGESLSRPSRTIQRECGLRLRILPDIISGTSAGGINGVLLAQALISGQSLEPLTTLWLEKADVDVLLDPDAGRGAASPNSGRNRSCGSCWPVPAMP